MPQRLQRTFYGRLSSGVAIACVALTILGTLYVRSVELGLIETAGDGLATAAAGIADDLDGIVRERANDIRMLAAALAAEQPDPAFVTHRLITILRIEPMYRWLLVTDATGRVIASTNPATLGTDRGGRAWFKALRGGETLRVEDVQASENAGDGRTISFASPIRDRAGTFLGTVRAVVGLRTFRDLVTRKVTSLESQLEPGARIRWQLAAGDGTVIADSLSPRSGKPDVPPAHTPPLPVGGPARPGWAEDVGPHDGTPVLVGYDRSAGDRASGGLRWWVVLGLERSAVLAPVRRSLSRLAAGGVVVVAPLLALLAVAMVKRWRTEEEVRRAYEELDRRVEERTAALSRANETLREEILRRQEMEASLRESEARWRAVSELTSDWAYCHRCEEDGTPVLEWVTEAFTRITGFTQAEVQALGDLLAVVHPDDRDAVRARASLPPEERPRAAEIRIVTKRGEVRWIVDHGPHVLRDPLTGAVRYYGAVQDVTERKHAEEALRLSEERHRALVAATTSVVWTSNAEGKATCPLPSWEAYTGQRWDDCAGMGWLAMLHPDERDGLRDRWLHAVGHSTAYEADARIWHAPSQQYRHCVARATALLKPDGTVREWIGTLTDVDERRRADEMQARLAAIVETSSDAIIGYTSERLITAWNGGAERLFGYPADEIMGGSESALVPPDRVAEVTALFDAVGRGESIVTETVRVRKDGTRVDVALSLAPIRNADGRITGASAIMRDVTGQKQADEAVRQSERELADFFDHAAVGLHWLDPDGRILRANQAELGMLGYASEEYVGHQIAEFHADPGAAEEILRRLSRGEAVRGYEARLRCRDGTLKDVLIDSNGRLENGVLVRARGCTRDVSDTKRIAAEKERYARAMEEAKQTAECQATELALLAQELVKTRNAALQAARSKADFLANMSHEIRTPMTAILGYTDLLAHPETTEGEREACLVTIRRNGEGLLRMINDILDLSKMEAGKLTVERIPCDPISIINAVASLMRVQAVEKGVTLEVSYASPIPARIESDPARLRQILFNLVGNAIKFTEAGSVRLVVRMTETSEAAVAALRFEVIDTGIGMTPETRQKLFAPFTQADASITRRFGGTGLGLTISKRLAGLLGGDIVVESATDAGSTFVLTVETGPVDPASLLDPHEVAAWAANAVTAVKDRAARLAARILLAEDVPDNQRLISHYLRKAGAEVAVAENGRVACEMALATGSGTVRFDAILMDMQMPEVDGYTATSRLREAGYAGPILALTAHAMPGDRARCLDVGCNDFLTKPVDRDTLIETLRQYVAGGEPPVPGRQEPAAATNSAPAADMTGPLVSTLAADPELVPLVQMFVAGLPERAAGIERALAEGDVKALAVLAHQLKGTAGGYGFATITEAAAALQTAAKTDRPLEELRELAAAVLALCGRARATPPDPAPLVSDAGTPLEARP